MDNKYSTPDSKVIEMDTRHFNGTRIIHPSFKNKYGILKVYAPWCPHCTAMVTDLKYLAAGLEEYDIVFGAVNADNPRNADLVRQLGVQWFPYLYLVDDTGNPTHVDAGDKSVQTILDIICNGTKQFVSSGKGKAKSRCCTVKNNKIDCGKK